MRDLRSPLDGIRSPFGASRGPTGPTNTVAPVVSGTATVGQTTSSTTGTWSGEGTITYAYQWLKDGVAISGATSSTYTLTAGEEGGLVSCRVTATDDNGSTSATSNSVGPVAAAPSFDPATLFASGENGAWFEAADTTFDVSTHLNEATAGDPVGFAVNRAQDVRYAGGAFSGVGSEVLADPGFDTGTGWNVGGEWLVSGGQVSNTGSGSQFLTAAGVLTVGEWYLIEVDIASTTGSLRLYAGSIIYQFDPVSGVQQTVWKATTTSLQFWDGGGDHVINGISCKPLPGNHAYQATTAARPTLRAAPAHLEDDGVDDSLNWDAPAGTYTVARVNSAGTVTIQTGQSLSGATDIMLDSTIVAYIAVDRALTGQETTDLTAYLEGLV